ncbi:glycoside hydrolase family 43 protein [Algoriphagus hitonicola]|uniref:Glycosyl hydrolases family 43 n=1 Tax=Algoriphagus hitonicola TaxID=435880 RepID=A0A1I2UZ86_9BACT|nr:glycoside hydrolase family 43 protein [Algoriphagus hitonicola]SFG80151.1 Glycosyl hydrolases family 43 [Algoriphagus hitonicola]
MKFSIHFLTALVLATGCSQPQKSSEVENTETVQSKFAHSPLVEDIYTADPSAHIFEGKIYIYPSHDIETEVQEDDMGSHFDMKDYHVFSMDQPGGEVTGHGVALKLEDVPWAGRQLWAPDAAEKDGKYYLYFPAKDKADIFKIGVAISDRPEGPFTAEPEPIAGTFSMDPAVFHEGEDYFLLFGGIWGGQLQWYENQELVEGRKGPTDGIPAAEEKALMPYIAKLDRSMTKLAEKPRELLILDENGEPIKAGENDKRFFEAAWMHEYEGKYYLSYSTGDTHFIAYATGDNPYGPFTYQGNVLEPVEGWTNHHSIVEFEGKWYLFYHDTELSGKTPLRNIKMAELTHLPDGKIQTINPMN